MAHKNFYLSVKECNLLVDLLSDMIYSVPIDLSQDEFNSLCDLREKLLNSLGK